MVELIAVARRPRRRLRDHRRRLPRRSTGSTATGCSPARASTRCAPGRAGRARRGEALAARLRAVEEGQARRAHLGVAVGPGPPGLAHRVRGHVARPPRRGLRPPRRAASTSPSPTTRTSAPRPSGSGGAFARHWVHNGWVMVEGEKMSKSLGNFTSLTDLLERADARAYRLLVLRAHYRSPIEVTPATVEQAEQGLARLDDLARRFDAARPPTPASPPTDAAEAGADADARGVVRGAHGRRPRHPRGPGRDLRPGPPAPTRPPTPATPTRVDAWRVTAAVLCGALGLALGRRGAEWTPRPPPGGRARPGPGRGRLRPGRRHPGRARGPGLGGRGRARGHAPAPLSRAASRPARRPVTPGRAPAKPPVGRRPLLLSCAWGDAGEQRGE